MKALNLQEFTRLATTLSDGSRASFLKGGSFEQDLNYLQERLKFIENLLDEQGVTVEQLLDYHYKEAQLSFIQEQAKQARVLTAPSFMYDGRLKVKGVKYKGSFWAKVKRVLTGKIKYRFE